MLNWQIGVEIELMAPRGLTRQTLAEKLCPVDGEVKRFFHPQSEPSKVPNMPVFENLTLGFAVFDKSQNLIVQCVDDLTLQEDCRSDAVAQSGWYRIVSDDRRLLELVKQQCTAHHSLDKVLNPIAKLFNTSVERNPNGMVKVTDSHNLPIAIASPLPGERERPCEIVTPPLTNNHYQYLHDILQTAVDLGFSIPIEGATHIHFDAQPLANTRVFCNLVNLFWTYSNILKGLVKSNRHCRRLGHWHLSLLELVNDRHFRKLSWQDAQQELMKLPLTKYCDFNIKNIVHHLKDKYTFEVRIFPVSLDAQSIIYSAELIQALLYKAMEKDDVTPQASLPCNFPQIDRFLKCLKLDYSTHEFWLQQAK